MLTCSLLVRLGLIALTMPPVTGQASASPESELPEGLRPLASLVGSWKGQVTPTANRLRGWIETHEWAWAFEEGRPVGLALRFGDSKILGSGLLRAGEGGEKLRLDAKGPGGEDVVYEGAFDAKTRALVLDRVPPGPEGPERLTVRPNSNGIRYVLWLDRKRNGSPTYARVFEANLGREGVKLAGGAAQAEECIVTGGTATLTVTYQGKTYPLCCSGCREQFLEDPERYLRKASQRAEAKGTRPASGGAADDFGVGGVPAKPEADPKAMKKAQGDAPKPPSEGRGPTETPPAEPTEKTSGGKAEASPVATWLRLGQSLERQGKKSAALGYYRRIVREAATSAEATEARKRLEALGEKP